MIDATRFKEQRKTLLVRLQQLMFERSKLNNDIRSTQREMQQWDRALLRED